MQGTGRKRPVSSCIPCYSKKQKCNHEYPCNNCTRRRRPEECAYYPSQALQTAGLAETQKERMNNENEKNVGLPLDLSSNNCSRINPEPKHSLAELYGYFEDSSLNTLALVRNLGLDEEETRHGLRQRLPPNIIDEVQRDMERIPDRQVVDFLVQYFMSEVNWMDQLIHPPWFLSQYQRWWAIRQLTRVSEVEFAVLILRICSYASQFLPSPSYTLDGIRGVSLADIRHTCDNIATNLAAICNRCDSRGSLFRVQHLAFLGLRYLSEGKSNAFWEALNHTIRVAQSIGLHSDAVTSRHGLNELDREMRRRTFCNLYIWDSISSRQLDRVPFLPSGLRNWPLMRLVSAENGGTQSEANVPEEFTSRLLQARLFDFWRSLGPIQDSEYVITEAEDRYEKFCSEFLTSLPSSFKLHPDKSWDKRLPKLPLQRQLLHIFIFESLCWNYRPLLQKDIGYIQNLPAYKRVLLSSQKRGLAVAALHVLDGVTTLHTMMGGSHTRFPGIIFYTFEAAVLLAYQCMDLDFPGVNHDAPLNSEAKAKRDPLRVGITNLTREECIQAIHRSLNRLRMLAEVSSMAEVGAHTLAGILNKIPIAEGNNQKTTDTSNYQYDSPTANKAIDSLHAELPDSSSFDELISLVGLQEMSPNWEPLTSDFADGLTAVTGPIESWDVQKENP